MADDNVLALAREVVAHPGTEEATRARVAELLADVASRSAQRAGIIERQRALKAELVDVAAGEEAAYAALLNLLPRKPGPTIGFANS